MYAALYFKISQTFKMCLILLCSGVFVHFQDLVFSFVIMLIIFKDHKNVLEQLNCKNFDLLFSL